MPVSICLSLPVCVDVSACYVRGAAFICKSGCGSRQKVRRDVNGQDVTRRRPGCDWTRLERRPSDTRTYCSSLSRSTSTSTSQLQPNSTARIFADLLKNKSHSFSTCCGFVADLRFGTDMYRDTTLQLVWIAVNFRLLWICRLRIVV